MTPLLVILADSGDVSMLKVILGGIFVAAWLIKGLVTAINKSAEEAKRRQKYPPLPAAAARRPVLPQAVAFPPTARAKQQRGRGQQQQKRRVVAAPPPPVVVVSRPVVAAPQVVAARAPVVQRAATAPANQIGRLLQRPDSLRAALILNEVLRPPLSLRDDSSNTR